MKLSTLVIVVTALSFGCADVELDSGAEAPRMLVSPTAGGMNDDSGAGGQAMGMGGAAGQRKLQLTHGFR